MTNAEINAAISAWFEPDPEKLFPDSAKFWRYDGAGDPYPLDYFTSEDANARLLEAMPECLVRHAGYLDGDWLCFWNYNQEAVGERSADRKTAVVLAFLKFSGIAHKRDGGDRA